MAGYHMILYQQNIRKKQDIQKKWWKDECGIKELYNFIDKESLLLGNGRDSSIFNMFLCVSYLINTIWLVVLLISISYIGGLYIFHTIAQNDRFKIFVSVK